MEARDEAQDDGGTGSSARAADDERSSTSADEDERSSASAVPAFAATSVGAGVLFLVLRILAVSEWDWHTAFAISHTVDFDDVIGIGLGTFMAEEVATGILLIWLLPVSVIHFAWPSRGVERSTSSALLAVTMIAATVALVRTSSSWWIVGGAIIVGGLLLLARTIRRHGPLHRGAVYALRRAGATAVLAAFALAAFVPTPWVPLEQIRTTDGVELEGYVMDSESGFQKVLTIGDHELLILPNGDIDSRVEIEEP
jgi:hypothetical protein